MTNVSVWQKKKWLEYHERKPQSKRCKTHRLMLIKPVSQQTGGAGVAQWLLRTTILLKNSLLSIPSWDQTMGAVQCFLYLWSDPPSFPLTHINTSITFHCFLPRRCTHMQMFQWTWQWWWICIYNQSVSLTIAYGHTTLNTPDLVRSRKLSRVGPG